MLRTGMIQARRMLLTPSFHFNVPWQYDEKGQVEKVSKRYVVNTKMSTRKKKGPWMIQCLDDPMVFHE